MSDDEAQQVARGELVDPAAALEPAGAVETDERREAVEEPAKVMRIGSMIKQLLDEVRQAELDGPARERLKAIYDSSIQEVGAALSPDLRAELERAAIPFGDTIEPSDAELRIAQAQLVGWLEGLFHGIQATLFAQQMAARNQLDDLRRQLPPGPVAAPCSRATPACRGPRTPRTARAPTSEALTCGWSVAGRAAGARWYGRNHSRVIRPQSGDNPCGPSCASPLVAGRRSFRGRFVHPPPRAHRVLDARWCRPRR